MTSIKILNTKLVKPSSPTPANLKNYKLSFIDGILPLMEVGVLLFYTSKPKTISLLLEESVAKVLSSFYPLAGRFIIEDHIVDCSDQGAELLEAEAPDTELLTLLPERDLQNLHGFLPRKNHHHHQQQLPTYPILSIQLTNLKCGGLVIGISISHKIFDVSALSTFIAAWSNAVCNPADLERQTMAAIPTFDASSLFPSKINISNRNPNASTIRCLDLDKIAVKRFTFNKEAIGSLRSRIMPKEGKEKVSRVRAVCAVIATSLIRVDEGKIGRPRDCLITQAVNMRGRTIPPLHKHACGNLVILSLAYRNAAETGIQEMADLLGDATRKSVSDCMEILSLDEDKRNDMLMEPLRTTSRTFLGGESNVVTFTDYTKFGFYEMDFGWGKPVWAGIAPHTSGNTVVVMGNRDGHGIEAWVHLEKNDMRLFEEDEEIIRLCET